MPSVEIVVRLRADVARAVQDPSRADPPEYRELLQTAQGLGVTLRPLHPGLADPQLSRYLVGIAADRAKAEQFARELRGSSSIDAAYVKPPPAVAERTDEHHG